MYACLCRAVSERKVRAAVAGGASTVAQVRAACGAGTGCGGCLPSLRRLLREALPYDTRPYDARPCDVLPCDVQPCDVLPCDVEPCEALLGAVGAEATTAA
jgi:bacterioferritin-associated ferredoxin